jgi:predicted ATPase
MSKIVQLKGMKESGQFKFCIDYIRYPFYKNIIQDTKINFDFPITVFVGKNGSGKSSILKSLYGCVEGKNISDYWFSTEIDPIKESGIEGESRNCFIYNYPSSESEKHYEVLIQRSKRTGNPDYWETSRPLIKYGMLKKEEDENYRKSKLKTDVIYLNFHTIMSAFDKYKHISEVNKINDVNDYLRNKSKNLKKVLLENAVMYQGNPAREQNELPYLLKSNELKYISNILGKKYNAGKIIKHKFFKNWGVSTIFSSNSIEYSDAYAGSGENAVAALVHNIYNAKAHSIILLDEPENSLHPGAQQKIFDFLIEMCLNKKFQIIISTHSKEFINGLPNNAIKIFNELPNGKVEIINECTPSQAFYQIGENLPNKRTLIVEDRLSKEIIESVAVSLGVSIRNQINVQIPSGGSSEIKKKIAWDIKINENNKYVVLDGDEKINSDGEEIDIVNPNNISVGNLNEDYLANLIRTQIKMNELNFFGFNSNETPINKINLYRKYLEFYYDKVEFLPLFTPEQIIWNSDFQTMFSFIKQDTIESINNTQDFKEKFRLFALDIFRGDSSENIFNAQKLMITKWLSNQDENYFKICKILYKFLD